MPCGASKWFLPPAPSNPPSMGSAVPFPFGLVEDDLVMVKIMRCVPVRARDKVQLCHECKAIRGKKDNQTNSENGECERCGVPAAAVGGSA